MATIPSAFGLKVPIWSFALSSKLQYAIAPLGAYGPTVEKFLVMPEMDWPSVDCTPLNFRVKGVPVPRAAVGTIVMVFELGVSVSGITELSSVFSIITVFEVTLDAFTPTVNVATIVGFVGMFVGAAAPFISIVPPASKVTRPDRLNVTVLLSELFLQLTLPIINPVTTRKTLNNNHIFFISIRI